MARKMGLSLDDDPNFVEADAPAYSGNAVGDYSSPGASGYSDYPGAGANAGAGAATGAAAGAKAGPWGAIIGAAAGLLTSVMQQKAAEKAQKLKYQIDQQEAAQARLAQAQNRQVATVGDMAQRSSNAYQQLLGVLARSVR